MHIGFAAFVPSSTAAAAITGSSPPRCGAEDFGVGIQGEPLGLGYCIGYDQESSCCRLLPTQRAQVQLEALLDHEEGKFDILRSQLQTATSLAESAGSETRSSQCWVLHQRLIEARFQRVKEFLDLQSKYLQGVHHILLSGLCQFCLHTQDQDDNFARNDGPAVRQMTTILLQLEAAWKEISKFDAQVAGMLPEQPEEPEARCSASYLKILLAGSPALKSAEDSLASLKRYEAFLEKISSSEEEHSSQEAVNVALQRNIRNYGEAADAADRLTLGADLFGMFSAIRYWAAARRSLHTELLKEAATSFDEDFMEVATRMAAPFSSTLSRLAHQALMLALSSSGTLGALARLDGAPAILTETEATEEQDEGKQEEGGPAAAVAPPGEDSEKGSAEDVLVVLISNKTAPEDVARLLTTISGNNTLLFEDVCGDALESLGYGCHAGGETQKRCLAPRYGAWLELQLSSDASPDDVGSAGTGTRPLVAWRRHGGTRTALHSAADTAAWRWGEASALWFADLRGDCGNSVDVEAMLKSDRLVPGAAKWKGVAAASDLWGVPGAAGKASAQHVDLDEVWLPETPLSQRLASYMDFHKKSVAALQEDNTVDVRVLIWTCQSYQQCGGHGDRWNGLFTAFLLAVLTDRVFLIDSESPIPLQYFWGPASIDWRLKGMQLPTSTMRHHSYHDKRKMFQMDLPRLLDYNYSSISLNLNYRMLRIMLEEPRLQEKVASLGLMTRAPRFLFAEAFQLLFRPTPVLFQEHANLRRSLGGLEPGKFIAIHFRTGKIAYDPDRHGSDDLQMFLACAAKAERELNLPEETPWLLATDSSSVVEEAQNLLAPHTMAKLRIPPNHGRVHIDRSEMHLVLSGSLANYAEWLLFSQAAAAVLSRSYFGETAAEVGRVQHAFFAPGGGCVRTVLSSS